MKIVITGGTSGIGEKLKEMFLKNGDEVFVLARSVEKSDLSFPCDVADVNQVVAGFEAIKNKFGKIDILINNAGYGISGATELLSVEECKKIFNVNFFGSLYCIQNALPIMENTGKIINISSASALFAVPFRGMYCASKSAVSMMSNSLRMELANTKIQVTAICPGEIKTNFTKNRVKNFATNERYGDRIKNATSSLDSREEKRMSIDYATNKIYKIINKKHLKPQYIIGGKYKLLYFASKFVSQNTLLKFTNKFLGGK